MKGFQIVEEYECTNCSSKVYPPKHCGRPMELQENGFWVCWKGKHEPCCGRASFEKFDNCCNTPILINNNRSAFNILD